MELKTKTAKAGIPDREWIEFDLEIDQTDLIRKATFKAFGCHNLLEAGLRAAKSFGDKRLNELNWNGFGHWDLLIQEAVLKLKGEFKLPITEEELCHCRKIPTAKVDNAIVLGAQTPEKVRAWTSASSGCGTCRPNVEKLISYRTGKVS